MKREVVTTFDTDETEALERCERAYAAVLAAQAEHEAAIRAARALGLTVRIVGEAAGRSPAQVSRLTFNGGRYAN